LSVNALLRRRLSALAISIASIPCFAGPVVADAASFDPARAPTATADTRTALTMEGRAIPPANAPPRVKAVIRAANELVGKPYRWGGGHLNWKDRGYDCSGAISYALHAGGLLSRPLVSGQLMGWGSPGRGRWITVYSHATHVYAVIAGLTFESAKPGSGPRWTRAARSSAGFVRRHPKSL
jgi:hypothetical protein